MERLGFIHDKLEIKVLILYVLRKLPDFIDGETLLELTLCDDGISYFDYAECLAELVEAGNIEKQGNNYKITERGINNGSIIETSLPYSVRKKVDKSTAPLAKKLLRNTMIKATHEPSKTGGYMVSLGLSDGIGEIVDMQILASDEVQAELIKNNFKNKAEGIYNEIIELLTKE